MNLTAELIKLKETSRGVGRAEQAALACDLAKQFEKAGEYEAAYEALGDFLPARALPPMTDGLDELTRATLLQRVGTLAGWLGSTHQIEGNQERAKDLLTQSIEIFERAG